MASMGNDKETAQKAPLRLTRLRSQLPGAPAIMTGLNNREMATEPLSADPEDLSMREIRHRLPRRHPLWKPKIRLIVHPTRSAAPAAPPSNEQQEQQEPPRKKRRITLHTGRTPERNASASGTVGASNLRDSETDLPFVLQPEPPTKRLIFMRSGRTPLPWGPIRAGMDSQMPSTPESQTQAGQTEPEIKTEPGSKDEPGTVTELGELLPHASL